MARLRSTQLPPQTSDENIAENKLDTHADGHTTFSTANEEQQMDKQMEENNSKPSGSRVGSPETTNTPALKLFGRISGFFRGTPQPAKSASLPDAEQENTTASNADEQDVPSPSRVLFGSDGVQDGEVSEEDAQEKPAELLDARSEEEQIQSQIVEESLEADREKYAVFAIAVADEQVQVQQSAGTELDDIPIQPIVERSPQIEPLRPANSKLNKPKRAKAQILNDNSFYYSRPKDARTQPPEKDIYDFSDSSEEDPPQKKTKPLAHSQAAKRNESQATNKNEKATKRNETVVGDVIPPRRRGRPPKNSQNSKASSGSIEVPELPVEESSPAKRKPGRPKGSKSGGNQSSQANGISSSQVSDNGHGSSRQEQLQNGNGITRSQVLDNVRGSSRQKQLRNGDRIASTQVSDNGQGSGRQAQLQNGDRNLTRNAPAPKNDSQMKRKPTPAFQERSKAPEKIEKASGGNHHEPLVEIDDSQDEDEDIQPIATRISKKRRNEEISDDEEPPARFTKRAKTNTPPIDLDEVSDYNDPAPPIQNRSSRDRSTRSLSVAAPQKKAINLVREVAAAEEVARKAIMKVEAKKKEWKKAKAVAKELEEAAERWRTRLAVARAEAAAKEREAKGLPPLEKKKKPVYETSSDDEEDEENGVERVEQVFGRNNLSNVAPLVPWTQEEKDAIIQGLWDFKDNIATRFYDIYRLPVFRINDRNFDEVFAKIVDFRNDVGIKFYPNDEWIMSVPETVGG